VLRSSNVSSSVSDTLFLVLGGGVRMARGEDNFVLTFEEEEEEEELFSWWRRRRFSSLRAFLRSWRFGSCSCAEVDLDWGFGL
jgi:hypothetical protein